MRQFDKNEDFSVILNDMMEGQYYGNNNSYSYSAGFLSSLLEAMYNDLPKRSKESWKSQVHTRRVEAWAKVK